MMSQQYECLHYYSISYQNLRIVFLVLNLEALQRFSHTLRCLTHSNIVIIKNSLVSTLLSLDRKHEHLILYKVLSFICSWTFKRGFVGSMWVLVWDPVDE